MLVKDVFIGLSKNQTLNKLAGKYGNKLGVKSVVAGTNIEEMIESVKRLNAQGISATIDNLGEFVFEKSEAINAKERIVDVINAIDENKLNAHISLKPTQLGLDIDFDFCYENLQEIVQRAYEKNIFINFDMEDFCHLDASFDLVDQFLQSYDNVGTVIQAYFYGAADKTKQYKDLRLRLVKGAYKESTEVAYQHKQEIDRNYIRLIEYHLLHGKFTSIATHDHYIINHVKRFVEENGIPKDKFEFQMLYGFRKEMQLSLVQEGYNFCTYVPFGMDWYGYFMRRLAERPQNINLILRQIFNKKTNLIVGSVIGAFLIGRISRK